MKKCRCGSGESRYELKDAEGIFVAFVCSKCIGEVKGKYKPEIFEGSYGHLIDEPIKPDY